MDGEFTLVASIHANLTHPPSRVAAHTTQILPTSLLSTFQTFENFKRVGSPSHHFIRTRR